MFLKRFGAVVYLAIAIFVGFRGFEILFLPAFDGRFYWWPLTALGAPILMLVGGIYTLFPRVPRVWLVLLSAGIVIGIWAGFLRDFTWTYWIFGSVVTITAWAMLFAASALRNPGMAALIPAILLAVAWLPGLVDGIYRYLFPHSPDRNPPALLQIIVSFALMFAPIALAAVAARRKPTELPGLMPRM